MRWHRSCETGYVSGEHTRDTAWRALPTGGPPNRLLLNSCMRWQQESVSETSSDSGMWSTYEEVCTESVSQNDPHPPSCTLPATPTTLAPAYKLPMSCM